MDSFDGSPLDDSPRCGLAFGFGVARPSSACLTAACATALLLGLLAPPAHAQQPEPDQPSQGTTAEVAPPPGEGTPETGAPPESQPPVPPPPAAADESGATASVEAEPAGATEPAAQPVEAAPPAAPATAPACVAGQQLACACPGGASGVQVCSPEGGGFGPCQCMAAAPSSQPETRRRRREPYRGGPVPPDAQLVSKPRIGMLIPGVVLFALGYFGAVAVGVWGAVGESSDPTSPCYVHHHNNFYPLVGGLIYGIRYKELAEETTCGLGGMAVPYGVMDFLAQMTGLTLTVLGSTLRRRFLVYSGDSDRSPTWAILPSAPGADIGATFTLRM